MIKQELRAELLKYNRFLHGEIENYHLVDEYLNAMDFKISTSIEEVIDFAYDLFDVTIHSKVLDTLGVNNGTTTKKQIKLHRAQNALVRYILENNIKGYTIKNIYKRLFGYRPTRSIDTVDISHAKTKYVDDKLYEQLCAFLEGKMVDWSLHRENKELRWN